MPTVFRQGPYRFFFYAQDCVEPPHVHVQREQFTAKFWVDPVRLAVSGGMPDHELRDIEKIIEERQAAILKKWQAFCP
nr:DUF4160 domain-containing protein [Anaerolineae bacterium]